MRERKWENWKWSDPRTPAEVQVKIEDGAVVFHIPRSLMGETKAIDCAFYTKDLSKNDGWGRFFGSNDIGLESGTGDKYISSYLALNLASDDDKIATSHARLNPTASRIRIYQLFVRLFGNTNGTRKENGTLTENGVGKFEDINDAALKSLHDLGFTHIWLTGVLQQATATDYSEIGQPADDPDLLKGLAGSPFAIKDYFDVCPDYARDPARRLDEFKALLDRIHHRGMKALIDLAANHVARSYDSDIKPDQNFGAKGNGGAGDDTSRFFSPQNNFFYLKPDGNGPPLHLPTCKDGQPVSPTCKTVAALYERRSQEDGDHGPPLRKCDGLFDGEKRSRQGDR